jgi:hypothetical protein
MTKKPVYLIGGTGTALAMVFLDKQKFDYKAIEGLEMSITDLENVTTRITNLSKELRAMLPGLENGGTKSSSADCSGCVPSWKNSVSRLSRSVRQASASVCSTRRSRNRKKSRSPSAFRPG